MASSSQSRVDEQIRKLQLRVAVLERALKPKRRTKADSKAWENDKRESAEIHARSQGLREYYDREREQRLRENPNALRVAFEEERKVNAFLKSKGLKPYPTTIPPALRRKARRLAASPDGV